MQSPEDLSITLTRVFDAPRHLVYAAWTQKKHLDKWCAPRGFTIPESHAEFHVGGEWRCVMVAPNGEKLPVGGVYHQIIPNELLVMSHIWEEDEGIPEHKTILTIRFADEGQKTKVTLEQSIFKSVESREGHRGGWTEALDILGDHLAKIPFTIERTFSAPADIVWKAITDPAQMREWYFDDIKDFKPEVGFETRVVTTHDGKVYPHLWKVKEVVPGKKLAYSWRYEGHPGDSLVTFELFPEGDKTRVKLTHSGLETFEPDTNPKYARSNFAMGWTSLIGTCLQEFLDKPSK